MANVPVQPNQPIQGEWIACGPGPLTFERFEDFARVVSNTVPGCTGCGVISEAGAHRWWFTSAHPGLSTTLWIRMEDSTPVQYAVAGSARVAWVEHDRWSRVISGAYRAFRYGALREILSPYLRLGSADDSLSLNWTGSLGGPLVVLPTLDSAGWGGFDLSNGGADAHSDYERAGSMSQEYGVLSFGRSAGFALILRDSWATAYLPELRSFVRWIGADSEEEVKSAARDIFTDSSYEWKNYGFWRSGGSAFLMDSYFTVSQLNSASLAGFLPGPAVVELPLGNCSLRAGKWSVDVGADESATIGMLQLTPQ